MDQVEEGAGCLVPGWGGERGGAVQRELPGQWPGWRRAWDWEVATPWWWGMERDRGGAHKRGRSYPRAEATARAHLAQLPRCPCPKHPPHPPLYGNRNPRHQERRARGQEWPGVPHAVAGTSTQWRWGMASGAWQGQ